MKKQSLLFLLIGIFLCLVFAQSNFADTDQIADDALKQIAPRIYLDCSRCDRDYVRTEIDWINYVRDRKEADVHILGTVQRTGSGGWEYTFEFIGHNKFSDITHTLTYVSSSTDTWVRSARDMWMFSNAGSCHIFCELLYPNTSRLDSSACSNPIP